MCSACPAVQPHGVQQLLPDVCHPDAAPVATAAIEPHAWPDGSSLHGLVALHLQGGSFTISNLGMYGVDQFCAIINPPQASGCWRIPSLRQLVWRWP